MLEGRAHQARRLPVRALPGAVDVIGGEDGDRSNVLLKKFCLQTVSALLSAALLIKSCEPYLLGGIETYWGLIAPLMQPT